MIINRILKVFLCSVSGTETESNLFVWDQEYKKVFPRITSSSLNNGPQWVCWEIIIICLILFGAGSIVEFIDSTFINIKILYQSLKCCYGPLVFCKVDQEINNPVYKDYPMTFIQERDRDMFIDKRNSEDDYNLFSCFSRLVTPWSV